MKILSLLLVVLTVVFTYATFSTLVVELSIDTNTSMSLVWLCALVVSMLGSVLVYPFETE